MVGFATKRKCWPPGDWRGVSCRIFHFTWLFAVLRILTCLLDQEGSSVRHAVVGVDAARGSWPKAPSRAYACRIVNSGRARAEPADCTGKEQPGVLHFPRLVDRR